MPAARLRQRQSRTTSVSWWLRWICQRTPPDWTRLYDSRMPLAPGEVCAGYTNNNATEFGGYKSLVAKTEEAAKVPAALVAVLAYWGTPETDGWWVDDLIRFATRVGAGGLVGLLELRLITGSVLYYAAGLAATVTKKYDLLARMFRLERDDPPMVWATSTACGNSNASENLREHR